MIILRKIGSIAAVLAGAWLCLRWFEWKSLYYPDRKMDELPSDAGLEYEEVWFVAEDGTRLHGWWIPHPEARGTVIHLHGNAGNISSRIWIAADLNRLKLNVFLFDWRGYGLSRGLPREKGLYRDARAAYEVVRAKYDDAENPPVILHGQSLGGAVAAQLALDKPCRGLIIESSFSSVPDMARVMYPALPAVLIRSRFDTASKMPKLKIPVIVAHSRTDDLVPYEQGRKIFEAANEPKTFCELSGGHNEAGWHTGGEYWSAIEKFAAAVFPPENR